VSRLNGQLASQLRFAFERIAASYILFLLIRDVEPVEDITEIKRAQEEALSRAKLGSAGTLAGGIAHDFNNLLGHLARPSPASIVLVVEDEDPLRRAMSKMLGKRGVSVIEAGSGWAALDALRDRNNTIDVLFLDISLPGASGREVLEEARRLRPEMRVIVTSAYPEEMAATSLQSTIEHFIRKPYRLDDVMRLIDSTNS
jgi:CheY-like chemotaxis protein